MSFLLWFVAIGAGLVCLAVSAVVGQTPVTEGLFGLSLFAGAFGFAVDRVSAR
jgi:hypothetical protein